MMLISEPLKAQAVRFRAFDEARPIDVLGDIGVTDLIERRTQMPMSPAHLQRSSAAMGRVKFFASKTIIDDDHKPTLQFRREIADPIERSEIDLYLTANR